MRISFVTKDLRQSYVPFVALTEAILPAGRSSRPVVGAGDFGWAHWYRHPAGPPLRRSTGEAGRIREGAGRRAAPSPAHGRCVVRSQLWCSYREPMKKSSAILLLVLIGWLVVREWRDSHHRRLARDVVHDLGGRAGSLPNPIPFLGDELRYEFHGTRFTSDDISRLAVLQNLSSRHWVGIMFKDTNLTRSDMVRIRRLLPGCRPFRVVDGERLRDAPLDDQAG